MKVVAYQGLPGPDDASQLFSKMFSQHTWLGQTYKLGRSAAGTNPDVLQSYPARQSNLGPPVEGQLGLTDDDDDTCTPQELCPAQ